MANDEQFAYAYLLARKYPSVGINEEGLYCEEEHYTFFLFKDNVEKVITKLGLNRDFFFDNDEIIPVLEAYDLDVEKFWYAVVYIASLTTSWAEQKRSCNPLPTAIEQLKTLRNEIVKPNGSEVAPGEVTILTKTCHEFKVVFDDGLSSHSVVMAGNGLMHLLIKTLDDLIANADDPVLFKSELPIWRKGKAKKTEMTWYAANLFTILFGLLKLPTKRARSVSEYRYYKGEKIFQGKKDPNISYDKNQLIAELIKFLEFTDNGNLDGNSINQILKSDREFKLDIF